MSTRPRLGSSKFASYARATGLALAIQSFSKRWVDGWMDGLIEQPKLSHGGSQSVTHSLTQCASVVIDISAISLTETHPIGTKASSPRPSSKPRMERAW